MSPISFLVVRLPSYKFLHLTCPPFQCAHVLPWNEKVQEKSWKSRNGGVSEVRKISGERSESLRKVWKWPKGPGRHFGLWLRGSLSQTEETSTLVGFRSERAKISHRNRSDLPGTPRLQSGKGHVARRLRRKTATCAQGSQNQLAMLTFLRRACRF